MVTTITLRGCLPSTSKLPVNSGSMLSTAVPLMRIVVFEPGIRNISATRGSRTILASESTRLLPRQSGSSTVLSSAIRTTQSSSPRGEQSRPSVPTVASAQKGEASIISRYSAVSVLVTLATDASLTPP
ncbi:hypothetical protein D9M72_507330 [compost metagenome]